MEITKEEAKIILQVLEEGMPMGSKKRMILARLANRIDELLEK